MKIFFDTNILMDIALMRDSLSEASKAAIMYCVDHEVIMYVSWHSISNAYYLIRNKKTRQDAYDFLHHFVTDVGIEIALVGTGELLQAFDKKMNDFEDAMQIAAAESCGADIIVTRNTTDFRSSPITIMTPEEFLQSQA